MSVEAMDLEGPSTLYANEAGKEITVSRINYSTENTSSQKENFPHALKCMFGETILFPARIPLSLHQTISSFLMPGPCVPNGPTLRSAGDMERLKRLGLSKVLPMGKLKQLEVLIGDFLRKLNQQKHP